MGASWSIIRGGGEDLVVVVDWHLKSFLYNFINGNSKLAPYVGLQNFIIETIKYWCLEIKWTNEDPMQIVSLQNFNNKLRYWYLDIPILRQGCDKQRRRCSCALDPVKNRQYLFFLWNWNHTYNCKQSYHFLSSSFEEWGLTCLKQTSSPTSLTPIDFPHFSRGSRVGRRKKPEMGVIFFS